MLNCIVHPQLDEEFYEQRVKEVEEKLEGEEKLEMTFVFMRGVEDCPTIPELQGVNRDAIAKACERSGSSSFRHEGNEYVVIAVDKPFLKENGAAMRGLIAHELMHTVQRHSGEEEEIEQAAMSYSESVVQELKERGYDMQDGLRFIRTVLSTAVLCLKDLYSNTELIRQSFSGDLEEYYYHILEVDSYCPAPEFYAEEERLEDIEEAIAFELRIMPAWLPFASLDREKADHIHEQIKKCYQSKIPQTSYYVGKVKHLYFDEFHRKARFRTKFFEQILEASYKLIDKKLAGTSVTGEDR